MFEVRIAVSANMNYGVKTRHGLTGFQSTRICEPGDSALVYEKESIKNEEKPLAEIWVSPLASTAGDHRRNGRRYGKVVFPATLPLADFSPGNPAIHLLLPVTTSASTSIK
jgi:hypothetical protein